MTNQQHINFSNLSEAQRITVIQRLTALWAFCESGLGGILHALQIPLTGFIVGGLAVIIISFIAKVSAENYTTIFQSLVIVLMVKAMVSPYTPFPAYIAVSFQALMGYLLFRVFQVNRFSILLLCTITMLESAIQQLLILTLFFGQSFWKAINELVNLISKQLGIITTNGNQKFIASYLLVYLAWGTLIAFIAARIIKSFFSDNKMNEFYSSFVFTPEFNLPEIPERKKMRNKLWMMIITMLVICGLLFLFAANVKKGWVEILKTISWTISAIMIWYMLIGPLFSKLVLKLLKKQKSRYSESIAGTLSFLPVLRKITVLAWQKTKPYKGFKRIHFFFSALLSWSLVYSDIPSGDPPFNNPQ